MKARIVFGILDILAAALYLFLFLKVVPSRTGSFTVIVVLLSLLLGTAGVGMIVGQRWGRLVSLAACGAMLAACLTLVTLLGFSAGYLHGIYDGVGQAGAAIAIISALLAIEVVGLLPALQLAHLLRHRGNP